MLEGNRHRSTAPEQMEHGKVALGIQDKPAIRVRPHAGGFHLKLAALGLGVRAIRRSRHHAPDGGIGEGCCVSGGETRPVTCGEM